MTLRDRLESKEYRNAYVESQTWTWLSYQIRRLREDRGWTQADLAERVEMHQSTIARLEHPDYEGTSLRTLLKLSAAFDVAFLAQFVSFDDLSEKRKDVSPGAMHVKSFGELP